MFRFDEILFKSASTKINEAIEDVEDFKTIASDLVSFSSDMNDIDITDIQNDILDIDSKLQLLNSYIANTNAVLENNERSRSGSGSIDEEELEEMLKPSSPFATDYDREYGATQGSPFELYVEYQKYMRQQQKNDAGSSPMGPGGVSPAPGGVGNSPSAPGAPGGMPSSPVEEKEETGVAPYNPFNPQEEGFADYKQEQIEEINALFEKYGITDENTIMRVLNYTKKQGCGQTVMTNWICEEYSDKPEEFEAKYGYPLYIEKDGHITYNYEVILTDAFLRTNGQFLDDNISDDGFSANNNDASVHVDEIEEKYGMVAGDDSEVTIVRRDVSIDTYQKMMEEGYDYACIAAYRFDLKPYGSNTSEEMYISDKTAEDGHWMTIVGISENGNFIVSSWGQEWELLSSDIYAYLPVDGVQQEDSDDACMVFVKK